MPLESLSLNSTEQRVDNYREAIETQLSTLIEMRTGASYSLLFEAARYSLLAPAKRLRPLLLLAATESLGGAPDLALIPACAIELIHTYSLIHDDLPCMDDDDLRRGRPTLHKVYPEGQAVLAGDFLLTYAFELLSTAHSLSDAQKVALTTSFARGAGAEGMIGGQVIDLLVAEGKLAPTWELLSEMHLKKTAALIVTALDSGAIVAHASDLDRTKLQEVGRYLGLAFQIVDDILDVTGTEKELGKPIGSDQRNQKTTAITLLGLKPAQELALELLASAEEILASLPHSPDLLLLLARRLVCRCT